VAIKVIVELQAEPGRRDELQRVLETIVSNEGPSQRGFLGSTRYEVLDNPDMLIEIAEWESAEARAAHMEEAAATAPMHLCSRCWPCRSGRRSSSSCPDTPSGLPVSAVSCAGRNVTPTATHRRPTGTT
jgi:quinol monooxygenase YgiN